MIGSALYARKRGDRWWRFQTLKRAFITAGHANAGGRKELRSLQRAFKQLGYGKVSDDLGVFWQELVALGAARKAVLKASDIEPVEMHARKLSPLMLPALCWLDFYRLCLGAGLFGLGMALRENSLARMAEDAKGVSARLGQVILGCYSEVERGNFDSAGRLLERMFQLECSEEQYAQARWFVELLAGTQNVETFGFQVTAPAADLEFGDFLKGKRIALVGPVPSKLNQGADVDGHDVVVKFGYQGGDKGRDPETQGERLDVSYYNNTQAQLLAQADYGKVFSSIRWGVCNNRKGRSLFPENYPGLRRLTSFQWMLADTHFNAGPNAIIDMLRFRPVNIKVFNTDLMLSSGRFAGYRPASAKPVDYTRSFIKTHDPILQYRIMHRLWETGYISGDERFNEVMGMGIGCYLDELQQAHGARDLARF